MAGRDAGCGLPGAQRRGGLGAGGLARRSGKNERAWIAKAVATIEQVAGVRPHLWALLPPARPEHPAPAGRSSRGDTQTHSMAFSSRVGRQKQGVRLAGVARFLALCQPARSISTTAWSPGADGLSELVEHRLHGAGAHRGQYEGDPFERRSSAAENDPARMYRTKSNVSIRVFPG